MIAREMLDRGVARRLAVICPAHLRSSGSSELAEKFAIEAVVLQPATMRGWSATCRGPTFRSYQYYPHLIVVSIDFIKSEQNREPLPAQRARPRHRRRGAQLRRVPRARRGKRQHQRYDFVRRVAADPPAPPYSGHGDAP